VGAKQVGLSIMDVERLDQECGQSLFEFMMMLPMLFGMVIILIKVNTAIQISIVDQQYARAQALFLTFNSPHYPPLSKQVGSLIGNSMNQMLLGVSDNQASGNYVPKATVQLIARKKNAPAPDTEQEEPTARAKVRIRNSVTLCTQSFFFKGQGGAVTPVIQLAAAEPFNAEGPVMLTDSSAVALFQNPCGSNLKYEQ